MVTPSRGERDESTVANFPIISPFASFPHFSFRPSSALYLTQQPPANHVERWGENEFYVPVYECRAHLEQQALVSGLYLVSQSQLGAL